MTRSVKIPALQRKPSTVCLAVLAVVVIFLAFRVLTFAADKEPQYQYKDTRRLVNLVDGAAALVQEKGEQAFVEFQVPGSRWFYGQYYIFAYAPDGTCLFHPVEPELVGKNMMGFRDMNGKPVIELITQVGTHSRPDRGWVFYLWPDKTELLPRWKSAYIRRVVDPEKREYFIGSGVYNIKTERAFIEDRVRMAANLLENRGKEVAFGQFRSRATPFVFLDAYIFVLDLEGRMVFDPAYPTLTGRNVANFRDAVGAPVISELLAKLEGQDEAWVQYLWPRPGASLPSRKSMHAHKVKVGNESLVVGSDFFLATPIWMR